MNTIAQKDIQEFDLLFYRPSSFFGRSIALYDAMKYWYSPKTWFRILFKQAFSHVGIALRDSKNNIRRYDAMEGLRTGFRQSFENCYVFSLSSLDDDEKEILKEYLINRKGALYDKRGILSFIFKYVPEDEFRDYCSELIKNGLAESGSCLYLKDRTFSPFSLYQELRPRLIMKGIFLGK